MPERLSKLDPRAIFSYAPDVLANKPEAASLVAEIFAYWSSIEHEMGLLLLRLLGAEHGPALAMYSVLTSPSIQRPALIAAAGAALTDEQMRYFSATIAVATSAGKPRNKLAHWLWGRSDRFPDDLLLADPRKVKEYAKYQLKPLFQRPSLTELFSSGDPNAYKEDRRGTLGYDADDVLVYRLKDLQDARDQLCGAQRVLKDYAMFLRPLLVDDDDVERLRKIATKYSARPPSEEEIHWGTSGAALRRLLDSDQFRAALAQLDLGRSKNP